jgi:TPR repeat protein
MNENQDKGNLNYNLGYCYQYGKGVKKDLKKAIVYYKISAKENNSESQFSLGKCYQNGEGVKKNKKKTLKWFKKAAKQGHIDAQYNLAMFYEFVDKSFKKVIFW